MPDHRSSARTLALGGALLSLASLSGCLYATGGIRTFDMRVEPVPAAYEAPAPLLALNALSPSAVEIAYARDTGRVVFRRRDVERTRAFVSADPSDGYALCLRSGKAYALLVFQRRVFEPGISQVADDAAILRRDADTAICRSRTDWTAA
ncbi:MULTISPECIES: hypothetical protein [unclassified Aureimonas]|uniref:hypothetical protein n=1 Tax=unclassified Aureimonas TaxID=2615206 RepID=UPI0006F76536|nr:MULTISPECIES: hypothetical protein [unclassified Aureimonas]KQT57435.1 hypothetical protein ASG62_08920 [Aureimonas sp. Leaf427]KQT77114.1 hypothetical protein ASG54_12785 [Aureimonas sp. Leaf460]